MEDILKQTNGIGSTFYDMDLSKNHTRGLWIIPKNKMETINKQDYFKFNKLDSNLIFEKNNQIGEHEFVDELVSIIT